MRMLVLEQSNEENEKNEKNNPKILQIGWLFVIFQVYASKL